MRIVEPGGWSGGGMDRHAQLLQVQIVEPLILHPAITRRKPPVKSAIGGASGVSSSVRWRGRRRVGGFSEVSQPGRDGR